MSSPPSKDSEAQEPKTIKCMVWDLDDTLWDGILIEGDQVQLRPEAVDIIRALDGRGILQSIASGEGPGRYMMFLGHSGWGPGQLENEIAQGAWIPAALNLDLMFETPPDQRWDRSLENEGLHPAQVGFFRPQAN